MLPSFPVRTLWIIRLAMQPAAAASVVVVAVLAATASHPWMQRVDPGLKPYLDGAPGTGRDGICKSQFVSHNNLSHTSALTVTICEPQ